MWTNPPLNNDRFHPNYEVTITKPDGTQKVITLNSYCADSTSWFEYTADQIGTWKLKFDFFGTYFPAGRYLNGYIMTNGSGNQYGSVYYTPASTKEQTLTVQQDPIYSWPQSSLPTDYWTRPAEPQNREWWTILGNYPSNGIIGGGSDWPTDTNTYISNYDFYPYVQAPNTAHIVWKRQGTIGGIVGGSAGQYSLTGGGGNPSVIYAGRCYQTYNKQGVGSVAACYDLRTGQVYYEIPVSQGGVTPSYISYAKSVSGGTPAATESEAYAVSLLTTVSGRLIKVDPWTGQVTLNVSAIDIGGAGTTNSPIAPSGFYQDPYALSVQTLGSGASISYRLINWTTAGSSTDFSTRIISNVSYLIPRTSLPYAVDFESNIACQPYFILDSVTGQWHKTTFTTIDLTTGALLWNITADETLYSPNCVQADHGKLLVLMQTGKWNCYDLRTGNLLWKSESMDYPWSAASFGAYECQSYGGLFYREAYDGVYAFNWTDGKIVWHFVAPTPFQYETPYTDSNGTGVYSFNAGGIIADGKLYVYNTEHTPTQPITRGWKLFCINATSGINIWNITGCMTPGGIADGYLTASNSYDGYMYVFGKGQSATTISAPQLGSNRRTKRSNHRHYLRPIPCSIRQSMRLR